MSRIDRFLGGIVLALIASCAAPSSVVIPRIVGFSFTKDSNSALSADYPGVVDQNARTITVWLPATVDRTSLTPTLLLGSGSSLASAPTARDFTNSPVRYVVSSSSESVVYLVTVKLEATPAADDALIISEYYCGNLFSPKGTNNQYLEITNRSASAVDLSAYELRRTVWERGLRTPSKDTAVALTGSLAAGASLVVYSSRLSTSTFTTLANLASASKVSDLGLNTLLAFTGYDGYQLVRQGRVLDVLGPNGGQGSSWSWGGKKRLLRKSDRTPSPVWSEEDWITYGVTGTNADMANLATATPASVGTSTNLTFFAFEGLVNPVYGSITGSSVSIQVPEGTSLVQSPTVSTDGWAVWYQGESMTSGTTKIDFSSPVTLRVIAPNKTTYRDYTVTATTYHILGFTTTNYDFSGGIAAAVSAIRAGGAANTNSSEVALNTTLEGILTSKDLYLSSSGQKGFTLQDSEGAVVFYSNTDHFGASIPLGSRIRVPVTGGKLYYDMPEITTFGTPVRVGVGIQDLYYQTGNFNTPEAIGRVYRWTGSIEESMDGFFVGTLEGSLFFHGTSALRSVLGAGTSGTFTGPVTYSYSQYRMELNQEFQIQ